MHQLSRRDARRIAVRAQLLDRSRPDNLLDVVRRLTLLQIDPTAAIAPTADLVAWSRLGSSYAPAELARGARRAGTLVELRGHDPALGGPRALPGRDGRLADPHRAAATGRRTSASGCRPTTACRRDILDRLRGRGTAAVVGAPGHL